MTLELSNLIRLNCSVSSCQACEFIDKIFSSSVYFDRSSVLCGAWTGRRALRGWWTGRGNPSDSARGCPALTCEVAEIARARWPDLRTFSIELYRRKRFATRRFRIRNEWPRIGATRPPACSWLEPRGIWQMCFNDRKLVPSQQGGVTPWLENLKF
jgi:hypothetical protein